MTHSQIVPPDYASTSETADDLIAFVGAERKSRRQVVNGMQQLTEATCGNFRIFSFSGDTAADHIDHFHAYARFFRILLHD